MDASDTFALASRAGRAPLDVSALSSRTPTDSRRGACARGAARAGEPGLGLSADPGRAGRAWDQASSEHRLDDSEGGGDRAGAEAARADWSGFLRAQPASILECDFLTVDTL